MSFLGRISIQASLARFIENLKADSIANSVKNLSVAEWQSKLDMLETYWMQFEEQHLKLMMANDNTEIFEHAYVKEGVYDKCLKTYSDTRTTFIGLVKTLDKSVDLSESFRRLRGPAPTSHVTQRQLPKISLPEFSGDFSEWTPYRNLFLSMDVDNPSLSTVEKFHYLLTSLTGKPKKLISTLPVTQDSFVPAWEILVTRYDNRRLLISTQLEKLFSAPKTINRSAKEFNALLNSVTEVLNALKSLERPTEHWDDVLVHLVAARLDSKTLEAWEVEVGSSTEFPTWAKLKEFVLSRAMARERIELHAPQTQSVTSSSLSVNLPPARKGKTLSFSAVQGSQPTEVLNVSAGQGSQPAATVSKVAMSQTGQGSTSQSWADISFSACPKCEESYSLDKCPKFKAMTPGQRKKFVVVKRRCFNCLGRHNVEKCPSLQKTCCVCRTNHHSMIHISPSQSTYQGASQPAPSQNQAPHSSQTAQPSLQLQSTVSRPDISQL